MSFCVFDPSKYEGQAITEELLAPAPGGVGELFIGGDCLATGYIKNPEKTQVGGFLGIMGNHS